MSISKISEINIEIKIETYLEINLYDQYMDTEINIVVNVRYLYLDST